MQGVEQLHRLSRTADGARPERHAVRRRMRFDLSWRPGPNIRGNRDGRREQLGERLSVRRYRVPALGDLRSTLPSASTASSCSRGIGARSGMRPRGGALGPIAVLGGGPRLWSPISTGTASSPSRRGRGRATAIRSRRRLGCQMLRQAGLEHRRYAFIDVSVSGSNLGNLMTAMAGTDCARHQWPMEGALITDHLHNDRRSGIGFEASAAGPRRARATWNNTGLWRALRLAYRLVPGSCTGARIVRWRARAGDQLVERSSEPSVGTDRPETMMPPGRRTMRPAQAAISSSSPT